MSMELSTYEASRKYNFSTGYLRLLLGKKSIKGRQVEITSKKSVWMIDEKSLQKFLKKERKPGPRITKKSS